VATTEALSIWTAQNPLAATLGAAMLLVVAAGIWLVAVLDQERLLRVGLGGCIALLLGGRFRARR